jgi:DNA-directed RNA polymerase subunit RPC12/RpoP
VSINFQCGHCGKNLLARDEHAGKGLACPACGQALTVPAAPPLPRRAEPGPASSRSPSGGLGTRTCPDCAEQIQAEARVCRHCGRQFTEAEQAEAREEARARQAEAREQARARAAALGKLLALADLERRRKLRFGWGVALLIVGGLLQALWLAMLLTPPAPGNTAAGQRFAALAATCWTSLPALLCGAALFRSAGRLRRQWRAALEEDGEEVRRTRLDARKRGRVDWGIVLAAQGCLVLVCGVGILLPDEGESNPTGRAAAGAICMITSLVPLLLGGFLVLRGILLRPDDADPSAPDVPAAPAGGAAGLAGVLGGLDEGGAASLGAFLNEASPEEARDLARRLNAAGPDEVRRVVRDLGRRTGRPPHS